MPVVGVAEALPFAPEEIEDIQRRLHERDVSLDLHHAFPRLIASWRERGEQIQGQVNAVSSAAREMADMDERLTAANREISRRDAVIGVARRTLTATQVASRPLVTALDALDRGDMTLGT
jgi:hypothetical protein